MKEQFVTYEIALKLKELGFDEKCFMVYDTMGFLQDQTLMENLKLNFIKTPLWQQVIDWLWNKYHVVITRNPESVYDFNNWIIRYDSNTYTLEKAILKAIEILKEHNSKVS